MRTPGRLRSLLFAPAVRPDFVAKLPTRGADAVVIDCEDATPANAKSQARINARESAPDLAAAGCHVYVRVNGVPTEWFADDVRDALTSELAGVIVPKVETIDGLDTVADALDAAGFGELGVLAGLETARGIADARPLLAHRRVIAGYFGAEDFIADMGGVRTEAGTEVLYARARVALAARLAGVHALDQIVASFSDDERFLTDAREGRAIGYRGKMCIHPAQVPLANQVFSASDEERRWARDLLAAYEAAARAGEAAIVFEGQMIDEPMARRARAILEEEDIA
jgi:citrate lyase subunit beta/citryl-CoA lyase